MTTELKTHPMTGTVLHLECGHQNTIKSNENDMPVIGNFWACEVCNYDHRRIAHLEWPVKTGQKKDDGKPALDLIDPYFLEGVGHVLTFGAKKYELNQWQRGMAIGKAMAGVLRHCMAILRGEYTDPESGRQHTEHAACGLMFIHYFIRNNMLTTPDDRFKK